MTIVRRSWFVAVLLVLGTVPVSAAAPTSPHEALACDLGASPLDAIGVAACPETGSPAPEPEVSLPPASPPAAPCAPVRAYDTCEAWVSEFYNGPGNGPDSIGDQNIHGPIIGTSSDGKTVYTAGHSDADTSTASDRDIAILALDAETGAQKWAARYAGDEGHRDAAPLGLAVSDAGVFVTAILSNGTTDWFSRIIAFDHSGALMWDRPLGWLSYAIGATPGGRVITTGAQVLSEGPLRVDALTTSLDAETGETVWEHRQEGGGEHGILGFRLAVSGDGSRVAVLHSRYRVEEPHLGMTVYLQVTTHDVEAKEDPADEGGIVSEAEYPTFGYLPAGIVANRDGSRAYVAQGVGHGPEHYQQTLAVAVDTDEGRALWARRYLGPRPGMSLAFPWYYGPIALSPDERFVYVGSFISTAMNNGGNGFAVESLDARFGERIWTQEHPGKVTLCFGCGPTLAAVRDQVVVTVTAPDAVWAYQFMTVAYDDDHGTRLWSRIFRDGRSAHSGGVTPGPDGKRVYIAASAGTYTATATDRSVDILVTAFDI